MTDQTPQEGELILYRTADDAVRVAVLYESETFWLDQRRMAELFGVEIPTVSYHLKEIYASGELSRDPTLRKILRVQRSSRSIPPRGRRSRDDTPRRVRDGHSTPTG